MENPIINIDINKIMALSDNNFETSKVIIQLIKRKNTINLDVLTKFNITGQKIMNLYKNVCNQNYDSMIEFITKLENNDSESTSLLTTI